MWEIFYTILLVPHNVVMNLNNVMLVYVNSLSFFGD